MALQIDQFRFQAGERTLLNIEHCEFQRGQFHVVKGPSGAGKSTLLYGLAAIDLTDGAIKLDDQAVSLQTAKQRDQYRRSHIGLIFQNIHLFQGLDCLQNVLLPYSFSQLRVSATQRKAAIALLEEVGITDVHQSVNCMSRGEQQRIAIARALLSDADVLLADEPTASLDEQNSQDVIRLLKQMTDRNKIVIVTSHDQMLHEQADQLMTLHQGRFL